MNEKKIDFNYFFLVVTAGFIYSFDLKNQLFGAELCLAWVLSYPLFPLGLSKGVL